MLRKLGLAGIGVLALVFIMAEAPMAFGKSLVLCSQFNGTLVDESGTPQAGIKVTRNWSWGWGSEEGQDEAVTAADGTFSFPEVTGSSWSAGLLPHTPSIFTYVEAHGPNGTVRLMSVDKDSYDRDAELRDTPLKGPGINVICRIDKKPSAEGVFWGTCEPK